MKKVGPETSPTASAWAVEPKYLMKKVGPQTSPTAYIRGEKIWSKDFPYSMFLTCTGYIRDDISWCSEFL
jgi:hypothetical protein